MVTIKRASKKYTEKILTNGWTGITSQRFTWISNPDTVKRSKIYYFLCMLNFMLQTANPTSPFKTRLKELLTEYEDIVSLKSMGFPADWEKEKIWESVK